MAIELWISFSITSLVLLVVPGPTVLMILSYVLAHGRRTMLFTVPGVALGDLTAMSLSLAGVGALLAASASLFTALKIIGALYLVWLGYQLWRKPPTTALPDNREAMQLSKKSNWKLFASAYLVTALNPKGIVFFVAFVPQFIDPSGNISSQFAILTATFVGFATISASSWGYAAGAMRARIRKPATMKIIGKIGGSFLMGAGIMTALIQRSS